MACSKNRSKPTNILSLQNYFSSMITQLSYLIFGLVFISLFVPASLQTVLIPNRISAGQNNTLLLISNRDTTGQLQLVLGNDILLEQTLNFRKDEIVPHFLYTNSQPSRDAKNHRIEVRFKNGFVSQQNVEIKPSGGVIFFQSDKPIYRAQEAVRFRILRLDSKMRALNESVKLTIKNPQDIKFDEVSLQLEAPYYIATHSFNFPSISKNGIWSAEVSFGPEFHSKKKLNFELSDYELPNFKTKIKTPNYLVLKKNRTFKVDIDIDYIYDRVLNGTAYLKISYQNENKFEYLQATDEICFTNGKFTQQVTLLDTFMPSSGSLIVEAIVRDCSTNQIQSFKSNIIHIVDYLFKISTEDTILQYKPGKSSYVVIDILDPTGLPVQNIPLNITIKTRSPERLILPAIPSDTIITDHNGRYVSNFKIDNVGPIDVIVTTMAPNLNDDEQVYKRFVIDVFDPFEKQFIHIVNRRFSTYEAGNSFESAIHTSNHPFTAIYLIVSSKGVVYHYEKLTRNSIKFSITNQMSPNIRILVLGTNHESQIFADFIRIKILQKNCGSKVSIVSSKVTSPGKKVRFSINGKIGDVVGLHAIDEAVLVMQNSNHNKSSSFQQLENALKESDLGCGSGSGNSSPQIIQNAGFMVISENEANAKVFSSNFCKKNSNDRRKRRRDKGEEFKNLLLESNKQQMCCNLTENYSFPKRWSCKEKRNIVRKKYDESCAEYYFHCCKKILDRNLAASASYEQKSDERMINSANFVYFKSNSDNIDKNNKNIDSSDSEFFDFSEEITVRTDFRETWLFDLFILDDDHTHITKSAPHSITSWQMSTISLTERDGFCYANDLRLTTFKSFFLEVSLPSVMVEFEQTELVINVYNYHNTILPITVNLFRIDGICSNWGINKRYISENASIDINGVRRLSFPIYPYKRGKFQVKVTVLATTINKSDTVIKNITIFSRGVKKTESISFDIDPNNKTKRSTKIINNVRVDQVIPSANEHQTSVQIRENFINESNIVPDSVQYILLASARHYTPILISNNDTPDYIEQIYNYETININMLAHNLYVMMFMTDYSTQKRSLKTKEEIILLMKKSLLNQLKHRNNDGSFHVVKHNSQSSIQFTAYVTKILCQSSIYFDSKILDPKLIFESLKFLSSNQHINGSWTEIDPYISYEKTENSFDSMTLTAYIVGSIQQCSDYYLMNDFNEKNIFNQKQYQSMIDRGIEYIKNNYIHTKYYTAFNYSLFAYVLSLYDNDFQLTRQLLQGSLNESFTDKDNNKQFWMSTVECYPLETASFTLMTLINLNKKNQTKSDLLIITSIVNWLTSENRLKNFNRTIDYTITVEALSKYYSYFQTKNQSIELNSFIHFNNHFRKLLHFDQSNADLLQSIEVDPGTTNISIISRGFGVTNVKLYKIFNEFYPSSTCLFDLTIRTYIYTVNFDELDIGFNSLNSNENINSVQSFQRNNLSLKDKYHHKRLITCCFKNDKSKKRKKRSWLDPKLWQKLLNRFSERKTSSIKRETWTKSGTTQAKRSALDNNSYPTDNFPPLPYLGVENPIIKVLNICTRHLQPDSPGFTGLEVNLLSGYKPIVVDLVKITNSSEFIHSFDVFESRIIFYFMHILHKRSECIAFRVYELDKVLNRQPALVQVYKINEKTFSCARIYYDTQITANSFNFTCEKDEACKCRTNKICPNSNTHDDILGGKLSTVRLEKLRELFCTYKIVFIGTITNTRRNDKKRPHLIEIKVIDSFNSEFDTSTSFAMKLKNSCSMSLKNSTKVLVMHNSIDDLLLDGDSVLLELTKEENEKSALHIFSYINRLQKDCSN